MNRVLRLLCVGAVTVASCRGVDRPLPPSPGVLPRLREQKAGDIEFGGPETMHTIAEKSCPGAGVTAIWRGVTVPPGLLAERGLRSVILRFADGEEVELSAMQAAYDWPEVVFSPDCQRVALLRNRYGPYVIVATRDLRRYLKRERASVRYIDDQRPCALAYVYDDLRWLSNDEVEYRSGGDRMQTHRRVVDQAPDRHDPKPCLDPNSQLYEGPSTDAAPDPAPLR